MKYWRRSFNSSPSYLRSSQTWSLTSDLTFANRLALAPAHRFVFCQHASWDLKNDLKLVGGVTRGHPQSQEFSPTWIQDRNTLPLPFNNPAACTIKKASNPALSASTSTVYSSPKLSGISRLYSHHRSRQQQQQTAYYPLVVATLIGATLFSIDWDLKRHQVSPVFCLEPVKQHRKVSFLPKMSIPRDPFVKKDLALITKPLISEVISDNKLISSPKAKLIPNDILISKEDSIVADSSVIADQSLIEDSVIAESVISESLISNQSVDTGSYVTTFPSVKISHVSQEDDWEAFRVLNIGIDEEV